MRGPRGLSLVELLISMVVFGIVLCTAFYILTQGLRLWTLAVKRADQEDSVMVTLARLADRLGHTDQASLSLYVDPATVTTPIPLTTGPYAAIGGNTASGTGVGFLATTSDDRAINGGLDSALDADGRLVWDNYQIWYLGADSSQSSPFTQQALYVQTVNLAPASSQPSPYQELAFTPRTTDQKILCNVVDFEASAPLINAAIVVNPMSTLIPRDNPVSVTLSLEWDWQKFITHYTSAQMSENLTLDPSVQ